MSGPRVRSAWTLPAMCAALAAYIALHSPMRDVLSTIILKRTAHTTYFTFLSGDGLSAAFEASVAVVAIVAAIGAAAWAADAAGVRKDEWPLVFGISAFGLLVIPAAAIGGLAAIVHVALLRPPIGPLLVAAISIAVLAYGVLTGWRPRRLQLQMPDGVAAGIGVLACGLLMAFAIVSAVRPPTGFDALAYHAPLAVYLWRDGNLVTFLDRSPSGFALAHPGNAELWFGLLRLAGGEHLANLGQLPFALLAACAVNALARRLGSSRRSALTAAAAFLLAPIVVTQAGMQLNDIVSAALVLSGAALACAPERDWTPTRAVVTTLAIGLAITTKLAALPAAAALVAFVGIRVARRGTNRTTTATRVIAACAFVFVIAVAPWWIRNTLRFGNPLYPAAMPFVGRGVVVGDFQQKDTHFVPTRIAWPLYPLLEPLNDQSGFGPLFVVVAVPGVIIAARRRIRMPVALFLVVAAGTLPLWWTLTQHDPRHLVVIAGCMFACAPLALASAGRVSNRATAAVTIGAAAFSVIATVDQALMPRLRQPVDRASFYDGVWNVDPVVAGTSDTEPLVYNTGYATLSYAGDYALLGPALKRVLVTIDASASTEQIVGIMRRTGARYAYVPASKASQPDVNTKYPAPLFEIAHASTVVGGDATGTIRYLYRLRAPSDRDQLNSRIGAPDDVTAAR